MSDLAEISRKLDALQDMATRTSQDVNWIKSGMVRGEARMDGQDTQLRDLSGRMNRQAGSASVYGGFAGAVFAGFVAYFTRVHT
jgi:hypothetical protein